MAKNGRHNLAELLNYVYEIARLTASSVLHSRPWRLSCIRDTAEIDLLG